MDPTIVFCPNLACPARGHIGQGHIGIHSRQDKRFLGSVANFHLKRFGVCSPSIT